MSAGTGSENPQKLVMTGLKEILKDVLLIVFLSSQRLLVQVGIQLLEILASQYAEMASGYPQKKNAMRVPIFELLVVQ